MTRLFSIFLFAILLCTSCEKGPRTVLIETEYGNMKAILYDETPQHRDNFIKLASEGFYDDLLFHRIIPGFMIQGGDPDSKGAAPAARLGGGGPGHTIPAEFVDSKVHIRGALAAARTGQNNPEKRSSGSQFYIVQGQKFQDQQMQFFQQSKNLSPEQVQAYKEKGGRPDLDREYTVFGELIEGFDVLDKIAVVQTNPQTNRPVQDVKMKVQVVR